MKFIWDEEKETLNRQKHGISFQTASKVFDDVFRWEEFDEKHSSEEESRYITIGAVGDIVAILYVVYTPREDKIRIISARKATRGERRIYEYYRNGY